MWVFKLGGSLQGDPRLAAWLRRIAEFGRGGVVLVAGGGAFADNVRQLQRRWGFSDAVAHDLALLAMDQSAQLLAGLESGFGLGRTIAELRRLLAGGQVAVWQPAQALCGSDRVERSWRLTSDSLAAWLAGRLGARDLLLVKSAAPPAPATSAAALARAGYVDGCFPRYLAESGARCWYASAEQSEMVPRVVSAPRALEPAVADRRLVRPLAAHAEGLSPTPEAP